MKSLYLLGLAGAGLVAARPLDDPVTTREVETQDPEATRTFDNPFPTTFVIPTEIPNLPPLNPPTKRDAAPADPVVTRSFVLPPLPWGKRADPVVTRTFAFPGGPFGKRADPVVTRTAVVGNPFPTPDFPGIPNLPPLNPPFDRRAPADPVVTRSAILGDPFPPVPLPPGVPNLPPLNPPLKEREAADPVVTRTFAFPGGPFGRRDDPVVTRTAVIDPFPTPDLPPGIPNLPPLNPPFAVRNVEKRDAPAADTIKLVGLTWGGTGCPSDGVSFSMSDSATANFAAKQSFSAKIGKGVDITENRHNCQLNLKLEYPSNWQYTVAGTQFKGYAYLEKNVKAVVKSTRYFSGYTAQNSDGFTLTGPYDQSFTITDNTPTNELVWSPCGSNAMLNINSQAALTNTDDVAYGYVATNTPMGSTIYLSWRKC